ncbi:MAG: hypothetical protein DMG06_05245 [Acidobacteria bacterium]|nr:MAG: hypothetical protein DMG06_05245 [Acidobacteriota bacterium]
MSFGFAVECSPQNIPSCDKIQNGRHREGEAPAEPHGQGVAEAIACQEARPPNFFTPSNTLVYSQFTVHSERAEPPAEMRKPLAERVVFLQVTTMDNNKKLVPQTQEWADNFA